MTRPLFRLVPDNYKARGRAVVRSLAVARGFLRNQKWKVGDSSKAFGRSSNPLEDYFHSHTEGRGIWKWNHYFDIYHRHFSKFIDREAHVLEIGVQSGGSLGMWKQYFGPGCRVYGMDIDPNCKSYEDDSIKVFTGDQADRNFWAYVRREVPTLDIIIDDGGHLPHQQIVTLEEMLPHLKPGGVYLCEDVHGSFNQFANYMNGFSHNLNEFEAKSKIRENGEQLSCAPTQFQGAVQSVHLYPFVIVIEKTASPVAEFVSLRRGTQWQPFAGQGASARVNRVRWWNQKDG